MIRAVVFDLDNTLYPHRQYVEGAFAAMAAHLAALCGRPADALCRRMLQTWEADPARGRRLYRNVLEECGVYSETNERRLREIYHSHAPELRPFPQAAAVLRTLGAGYRLGLLTDGWAPTQRRKLEALGLGPLFEVLCFTGELGPEYYKPHPAGYRKALEGLHVAAGEAVFVGDNPHTDVRGARALGMWTVRICQGEYRDAPDDADLPPHRRCRHLHELPALVADLAVDAS
jgi:putative hydrolase of the HAD superfamily